MHHFYFEPWAPDPTISTLKDEQKVHGAALSGQHPPALTQPVKCSAHVGSQCFSPMCKHLHLFSFFFPFFPPKIYFLGYLSYMFFVRCAAQCSRSVCWRRSVSHICFALASCYRSEWTIRAVTRARHSIGTASEELHLKSTIQKDHRWLMALWRNPVISLGYLVFSGGQIWRTSDCFLPEVLSILTEGHREEASRHVCGYMRTGLWHLPSMYWRCYSLFSWGLFLSL